MDELSMTTVTNDGILRHLDKLLASKKVELKKAEQTAHTNAKYLEEVIGQITAISAQRRKWGGAWYGEKGSA